MIVELIGGPYDGERRQTREPNCLDGDRILFPIALRPAGCFAADPPEGSFAYAFTRDRIRCHVYVGPLRHPDRAHVGYRYRGIE